VPQTTEMPGIDLPRLVQYLRSERPSLLSGPPRAELIAGGLSNLTYLLDDGTRRWVLRRPPLGHVLATAHDMNREYRVISALAGSEVPVPRAELLCTDADVLGAPFYLMQYVPGVVMRKPEDAQPLTERQRHVLGRQLTGILARLHAVDPAAVGLADFGRPEGFLQRQVARWGKQLDASRSRELDGISDLHRQPQDSRWASGFARAAGPADKGGACSVAPPGRAQCTPVSSSETCHRRKPICGS
jgi:aminoglycoside phosphotransferase (APT) family kinase protein